MRSSTIQFKVVIIFFLAMAGILGAGIIAWLSLQKILKSVNTLAEPNHKLELLNDIQDRISNLNQVNQHYSFLDGKYNPDKQHQIVSDINRKVDSLKTFSISREEERIQLDSIQCLLDEIELGTDKLIAARKRNTQQNISSILIRDLSEQIENYKGSDSSYVVKSTTSEVRVSNFTLQKLDSLSKTPSFKNKPKFLKKIAHLFNRKKKEGSIQDTLVIIPDKQIDTLIKVSIDSVKILSNEALLISLQESLQELYVLELDAVKKFVQLEKSIQSKNIILLHTIEDMVDDIREEERVHTITTIRQAYGTSGIFEKTLSVIIIFFTVAGLLLLYLLLRDIRRTGYYQQQLFLEKEKANKEAKIRQQFLATMSHEIRTPLTSIIGYSDLLDDRSEYNHAIKKSSEHLLYIANEILDLAKIEAGIIEIRKEPVAIVQLLKDVQLGFQLKIKEKGLEGIVELPEDENLMVSIDQYKLNQVLYNLMHNAVKFTDKGFIYFKAFIESREDNKVELKIRIEDTGKGIHSEDQERVFEDYQQAGTHNDRLKGSGLGLGIVRKVVNLMGGTLFLESIPKIGTAFAISFLLEKSNSIFAHTISDPIPTLFLGKSILVVDDDPLIGRLHSIILTAYGAKVITTTSPLLSIEYVLNTQFDLAILDIQMPELTGIELLERYSNLVQKPFKVIASTANVLMSKYDTQSLVGFDAILYKPIYRSDLINLVSVALGIENKVVDKKYTTIEGVSNGLLYDLVDLKKFTMGDDELLQDILQQLYLENKMELSEAFKYLSNHKFIEVAEKIHKLASRFGQIRMRQSLQIIKKSEESLRSGVDIDTNEIYSLIEKWQSINELVKKECIF